MPVAPAIQEAFNLQAAACGDLGSPFTAHLCDRLPKILAGDPVLGAAIEEWPLDPVRSALALRLCGAFHRLIRSGQAPDLAALYPPRADTSATLDRALEQAAEQHGALLVTWLDSAPQTNEVARSGVLIGGLMTLAAETGLPLTLLEIGSSAGVNLYPEAYAYDFGSGRRWGPPGAPLTISCKWRGAAPPITEKLTISRRAGVDRAPIDPAQPVERERVLAYIWPDQPERLARTAAALDHAASNRAPIAEADAADWVEARLGAPASPGEVRILMHSITWQYLPPDRQRRIEAAMASAGASATRDTPLAWLRLEPDGPSKTAAVQLNLWPGGDLRLLGRGDFHGRFVDWI